MSIELCVQSQYLDITAVSTQIIKLYPNPANDQITIKGEEVINSYHVFTLRGELVLANQNIAVSRINLSIADLQSGIYFVQTQSNNGVRTITKLIKE